MKVDVRIVGGTVVDPARGLNGAGEVLIQGKRIVSAAAGESVEAAKTIDVTGCLVLPGLIDFHAHVFPAGTELGVHADSAMLPMGVTTVVDAGSSGVANYEGFLRTVVHGNRMRIFSFLHVCPAGLATSRYHEEVDPKYYDKAAIADLLARHRGQLLGLKLRLSKEIVGTLGAAPLTATLDMARELGCPVVVHTTNPPIPSEDLAAALRPGDVYCHVHHGTGDTILDAGGKVKPALREAQRRGVVFDASNGRNNFSFDVAKQALAQGFFPDVISTDVTAGTLFGDYVFSLPFVMMKYLNMGMDLDRVVAACTATPARLLGMAGKLGTLAAGACADVAVFRLVEKPFETKDKFGQSLAGTECLVPQLTLLDGKIAYRQIGF